MKDFHDKEMIFLLERLGQVQPGPEATQQALDRLRRVVEQIPPSVLRLRRRFQFQRYAAIAAAVLVMVGVAAWIFVRSPAQAWASFASVQAAMKLPRTVSFIQTTRVKGEPDSKIRVLLLGNSRFRAEQRDGTYTIMDPHEDRVLTVQPLNREAKYMHGIHSKQINEYQSVLNLANEVSARSLPGKGRDLIGFAVKVREKEYIVWANVKTRLPVHIEVGWTDDQGRIAEIVMDSFRFDLDLDPKLFAFELPAGYKLLFEGIAGLPEARTDPKFKDLVLMPNVGLGPVKFGMSCAEVERLLGEPDGVEQTGPITSVLKYRSHGFSVHVNKDCRGVWAFSCVAQAAITTRVRDFGGRTDSGITLGASRADIVALYGEPDVIETRKSTTFLAYEKLQMHFTLFGDKLVQMWISQQPATK